MFSDLQGAMYYIDKKNRNCTKKALKGDFHPIEVPQDAQLLGQAVVGSSSDPGEGLLVNTWFGTNPEIGQGQRVTFISLFVMFPSLYYCVLDPCLPRVKCLDS